MRLEVLLVASSLVTAGCLGLGGDEDGADGDDSITRTRVDVDDQSTAIQGVVTDNAVAPISGAVVRLAELADAHTTTADDGRYSLGPIKPGTYTLVVEADGFVPGSQVVEARAGDVALADFLLVRLASDLPYLQEFEHDGYATYGWGLGINVTGDALVPARDNGCDYSQLKDVMGGEGCRGEFQFDPPLATLVFEMVWEPSGPLATQFYVMMRVTDDEPVIDNSRALFEAEGPSPLVKRMDRADLDAVLTNWSEQCDAGDDAFCAFTFRDSGWPMQTRVYPGWRCPVDQIGFCVVLQQAYTQYATAFYNAEAPVGYTILARGGTAAPPATTGTPAPPIPGLVPTGQWLERVRAG